MAWTSPPTYTVGQVLTAANLNTYLRDNSNYAAGVDKPHARVFNSAAISCTNGTPVTLTYDSERVDVGALHSTSSNTSRLTVPTGGGGWWAIGASVEWQANGAGYRRTQVRANGGTMLAVISQPAEVTIGTAQSVMARCQLVAGDYIEVIATQGNSGATLNVTVSANYSPEVWAEWVAV